MRSILRFLRSEDGPTSVEYAVMLAAILMAVIGAVAAVGVQTNVMYTDITSEMDAHGM
jgi:pilus assembly protein Flp/PilA